MIPESAEVRSDQPAPSVDGRSAAEWHRYLHAEGMLVPENAQGDDCGPWHHRVFLASSDPGSPSDGGLDVERIGTQLWNALLGCDDRTLVQGWSREHVVEHLRQAVEVAARLSGSPSESEG